MPRAKPKPLPTTQRRILANMNAGRHHLAGLDRSTAGRRGAASSAVLALASRGLIAPDPRRVGWLLTIKGVFRATEEAQAMKEKVLP